MSSLSQRMPLTAIKFVCSANGDLIFGGHFYNMNIDNTTLIVQYSSKTLHIRPLWDGAEVRTQKCQIIRGARKPPFTNSKKLMLA